MNEVSASFLVTVMIFNLTLFFLKRDTLFTTLEKELLYE